MLTRYHGSLINFLGEGAKKEISWLVQRKEFLTSLSLREYGHSKHGVISGHFFKGNVAVSFLLVRLLVTGLEHEIISVCFGLGIPITVTWSSLVGSLIR